MQSDPMPTPPGAPDADPAPAAAGLHKNHTNYFVPGLQRGLMVLEVIATARRPLTVSEIAARLKLTRSSVFRLVYTLEFTGFLESVEHAKTYNLGPRVLNIGFAYLASKDIIEVARADLEILRNNTEVSAHLAIRDNREVLYLSCVQSRSGFQSNMNVGGRMPAYAVPMGWLLLSDLSNREIAALFDQQEFEGLTDQTPRDLGALSQCIARAAGAGFVISHGIMEVGGSSVSAPVFDKTGNVVAAIDISGPDSAFDMEHLQERYLREVIHAATRISARLGYSPPPARR
jgi:DNA-binding IclR family transcriptional regulator